jgi:hypothetical protein
MFATASSCGVRRGAISLTRAATAGTSRQSFCSFAGSGPDHIAPMDISARKGCSQGHSEFGPAAFGAAAGESLSLVAPGASVLCAIVEVATIDAMKIATSRRSV